MTASKPDPLVLRCAAAAVSLALALTAASFGASPRHSPPATPPAAADSALLSQVARAQAAAVLAQHPGAPVAALLGF